MLPKVAPGTCHSKGNEEDRKFYFSLEVGNKGGDGGFLLKGQLLLMTLSEQDLLK